MTSKITTRSPRILTRIDQVNWYRAKSRASCSRPDKALLAALVAARSTSDRFEWQFEWGRCLRWSTTTLTLGCSR
jgi:hypothetical protein